MRLRIDCTVKQSVSLPQGKYRGTSVTGYVEYGPLDVMSPDPTFRIVEISKVDMERLRSAWKQKQRRRRRRKIVWRRYRSR